MADLKLTKEHVKKILYLLDGVESDLTSAKNWGLLDIFGGKGISSLIKHSKISDSEKRLDKVIYEMELLQSELKFIDIPKDLSFNSGAFNMFLDIFSDNLFSDLYSQSKINDGLREIKNLKNMLNDIYSELNRLENQ